MSTIRTAEILAVGSELLTPFRLDTNSLYLTGQLNGLGIDVRVKSAVADDLAVLVPRLREAMAHADLVITTGGLGPTTDDLTREAVAGATGVAWPAERYDAPAGATLLTNRVGTAPGVWWPIGGRVVLLLPGPPRELQPMFEEAVRPLLAARTAGRAVHRRVIRIAGRRESEVEAVGQPIYGPLAAGVVPIETTILASPGQVELHLSARGRDRSAIDAALERGVQALTAALGPAVFSVDGRALEEVVGAGLQARGWRIGVAESCTGGLVGARLTDVAGSSAWFAGGVVAYANEVKISALAVPADLIATHGAVSEPVATAMAAGARRALGVDVGVAITGIAGPGGGSPEKLVGTVVIAVVTPAGASVRTWRLRGDRPTVRQYATALALDAVRLALRPGEPA